MNTFTVLSSLLNIYKVLSINTVNIIIIIIGTSSLLFVQHTLCKEQFIKNQMSNNTQSIFYKNYTWNVGNKTYYSTVILNSTGMPSYFKPTANFSFSYGNYSDTDFRGYYKYLRERRYTTSRRPRMSRSKGTPKSTTKYTLNFRKAGK